MAAVHEAVFLFAGCKNVTASVLREAGDERGLLARLYHADVAGRSRRSPHRHVAWRSDRPQAGHHRVFDPGDAARDPLPLLERPHVSVDSRVRTRHSDLYPGRITFALYVPELFPTHIRMRGAGFCNTVGRVMTIVTPYMVVAIFGGYGIGGVVAHFVVQLLG